jgi:hypothetical protein
MLDHDTDAYYKISRAFLDKQPSGNLTPDHIVDNITVYWLTGTGVSAAREYWESGQAAARAAAAGQAPPPVAVPVGFTTCPGEIFRAPCSWVQKAYPPSPTSTRPNGAVTSPPGKSPSCSRPRSAPRSRRSASGFRAVCVAAQALWLPVPRWSRAISTACRWVSPEPSENA